MKLFRKGTTIETASDRYFPALTGLRAVAASMVFLDHFNPFYIARYGLPLHAFVREFHTGVTIFFVLSGFLICYRYEQMVLLPKGERKIQDYFVNRFARIYPMYFIVTIAAFLPFACHCMLQDNWGILLLNLSFLRGFFTQYVFTGAATGWSLTVEEMFYALFPLIILLSRRIRIIYQPVLFIAAGLILWFIFHRLDLHGFFGSIAFLFEFTFFGRCFEFYTGILLAQYLLRHKDKLIVRQGATPSRYSIRTLAGMGCIIAGIALLAVNRQYAATQPIFLFFETLINNFLLPPAIGLLFYGLLTEQSFIRKALSTPVMELLGKASYIFYLVHNGFLFMFFRTLLHQRLELIYIALQIACVILYLGVEKPLNKLIRSKWAHRVQVRKGLSF